VFFGELGSQVFYCFKGSFGVRLDVPYELGDVEVLCVGVEGEEYGYKD